LLWHNYSKWVTGNQYVKVFGIAKSMGYAGIAVGSLADLYLSTHIDPKTGQPYQSWKMTGLNGAVTTGALIIGGVPGIVLETGYIGGKAYLNFAQDNPQYFKDYGILEKY
jgi:hypothetical protein